MSSGDAVITITAKDLTAAGMAAAKAGLSDVGRTATTVADQVSKLSTSFSGTKIQQEAQNIVTAIDGIGGAAKLTESEQSRVNRTVTEAIAKYKALGQEAPAEMRALAAATADAGKKTIDWKGELLGAAGAMGVMFSVGAVTSWIGKTVEAGSRISDLSKQLKVSTDSVQRWDYAISLSGGTIDDVEKSLTFLSKKLGEGDESTAESLRKIGLSFDDIRNMAPDDALNAVATAIGNLKDPMVQTAVSADLLGKTGKAMSAALAEGFVETGKNAAVMSKETVDRLDAAGDAWTKLGHTATIVSGEIIAAMMKTFDQPPGEDAYLQKWLDALHLDTKQAKADLHDLGQWLDVVSGKMETLKPPPAPKLDIGAAFKPKTFSTAELEAEVKSLDKYGAAVSKVISETERHAKETEEARKKLMAFHLEIGNGAIPVVQQLGQEIGIAAPAISQFAIKLDQNAIPAVQAFAFNIDMVPPKLVKVSNAFTKTFNEIPDILSRAFEGGGGISGALQSIAVKFGTDFGKTLSDSIAKSIKAKGSVFTGSSIGAALGMGGLAAGTAIASGASTGQQIGSVASTAMSVGMAAKAAGVATAGSVAFAAYTAGAGLAVIAAYKIWKAMNDGRKVMQDYYKTFQGGGDELRTRMLALGDAGEVLWKKLTQQTGKGDKAGAKAVIDEINTALAKNAETVGKMTTAQNGAMAGLIATSGTYRALPAAMKPYIDQLEAAGRITKENADLLRSMSGAADFGHMKDLASQFGIELDSLGPKFQQAQLTATATGIISAFDELIQGGADYNGVLVGMQDEISSVVQNSIKFGTEIPANMKPWIEQLSESGRLLDENGNKIEDVSGLKFGDEIKVGLGDVVDKLQEMIDLMKDGLPAAARAAAGGITTELGRIRVPRITIPVDAGDEGGGTATGVADESRSAFGSSRSLLRGFNPKTGQVAFAGAASSGGGQWVAAPIHMDAVRVGEVLLRRQGQILNRYRVNR